MYICICKYVNMQICMYVTTRAPQLGAPPPNRPHRRQRNFFSQQVLRLSHLPLLNVLGLADVRGDHPEGYPNT